MDGGQRWQGKAAQSQRGTKIRTSMDGCTIMDSRGSKLESICCKTQSQPRRGSSLSPSPRRRSCPKGLQWPKEERDGLVPKELISWFVRHPGSISAGFEWKRCHQRQGPYESIIIKKRALSSSAQWRRSLSQSDLFKPLCYKKGFPSPWQVFHETEDMASYAGRDLPGCKSHEKGAFGGAG